MITNKIKQTKKDNFNLFSPLIKSDRLLIQTYKLTEVIIIIKSDNYLPKCIKMRFSTSLTKALMALSGKQSTNKLKN